jgi:hypothetical protein
LDWKRHEPQFIRRRCGTLAAYGECLRGKGVLAILPGPGEDGAGKGSMKRYAMVVEPAKKNYAA